MDFLFDKIPAMSALRAAALPFALPELPNTLAHQLLSDAISMRDQVVNAIFSNMQQLRIEHNRASKQLSIIRTEHAQDYKKIFESKCL